MINEHYTIHTIHFLAALVPTAMVLIHIWTANVDQCSIHKTNTTLQLWDVSSQGPPLFYCWPFDLVRNSLVHTQSHKNGIIAHY